VAVEAWGQYPFDRGTTRDVATWLTGKDYGHMSTNLSGYGTGETYLSLLDPQLPEVNAATLRYHHSRWSDLFFQEENGAVPVGVEDTRGWMRDDLNVRFPVGDLGRDKFREWLKQRHGTIGKVNAAWGSHFASFEEIDPETYVLGKYGQRWSYLDPSHPFHDWNRAVEEFDIWRTRVRVQNYRDYLALAARDIPNPKVMFRTEGGHAIVAGLDPASPNAHFRHAYYGQRRLGAIAEILADSGTAAYHADYSTLPYTPAELRQLVRAGVAQGITPAHLPQFNEMRDVALNERYGNPYQVHYNLDHPMNGYLMHVLTAAYPWFQVLVEEGGIPGILWEDLECSGFVNETQKREIRFYQKKLDQALDRLSAEARRFTPPPSDWRTGGIRSYVIPAPVSK
jgi:hypothetical protein